MTISITSTIMVKVAASEWGRLKKVFLTAFPALFLSFSLFCFSLYHLVDRLLDFKLISHCTILVSSWGKSCPYPGEALSQFWREVERETFVFLTVSAIVFIKMIKKEDLVSFPYRLKQIQKYLKFPLFSLNFIRLRINK